MSLTRSISGLIHQDGFASLASWIGGTSWSVDTSRPTFIFWPSSRILMPDTGAIAGGFRECIVQYVAASETTRRLKGDGGDGSHIWQNRQYTTTDGGQSWTSNGNCEFTHGSHEGIVTGAPDALYGGVYYKYPGYSDGHVGNVNAPPYVSQIYSGASLDSTAGLTWMADAPPLGTSGAFDDTVELHGHVVINQGDGTAISYGSAIKEVGTVFSISRTVWSGPGSPGAPAQLAIHASISAISFENPKYIYWPSTTLHVLIPNSIEGGYAVANDALYATAENGWGASSTFRYRLQYEGYDSSRAVGMFTPFLNEYGLAMLEADESFGYSYDGNSTDVGPSYHELRSGLQGQAEASATAAKYTAPIPGTIGSVDKLLWNASHTNLILQFVVEWLDTTNADTGNLFELIWRANSNNPAAGDAYIANCWSGDANDLFKYVGGSTGAAVQSQDRVRRLPIDSKNLQYERWRLESLSNNHKLYIEDGKVFDFDDSSSPISSGTHFGFTGAGCVIRIRDLAAYKAKAVTVSGCGASAVVSLCGASGAIFDQQTADGSGNVTLTSDHYPMYSLLVNGTRHKIAGNATLWGGDTVAVVIPASGGADHGDRMHKLLRP